MNIGKHVVARLEQFVAKGPEDTEAVVLDSPQQKGYIFGVSAGAGPRVSLTLADYDRYSITLNKLQVCDSKLAENGDVETYLRQRAAQVTSRVSYLEEPLDLLELDIEAGVAQLRSDLPHKTDDEIVYWEALIQAKPQPMISLTRYRWIPNRREREIIIYPATFALVGRISQDLADSLTAEVA